MSPGKIIMDLVILALLITAIVLLILHFQKKNSISTLNAEIESIEKELAANQNLSASERARLEQALANLRAEKARIDQNLAELERQKKAAEERAAALEEQIKNTPTDDQLKKDFEAEQKKSKDLQEEIDNLKRPTGQKIKDVIVGVYNTAYTDINKWIASAGNETAIADRRRGVYTLIALIVLIVVVFIFYFILWPILKSIRGRTNEFVEGRKMIKQAKTNPENFLDEFRSSLNNMNTADRKKTIRVLKQRWSSVPKPIALELKKTISAVENSIDVLESIDFRRRFSPEKTFENFSGPKVREANMALQALDNMKVKGPAYEKLKRFSNGAENEKKIYEEFREELFKKLPEMDFNEANKISNNLTARATKMDYFHNNAMRDIDLHLAGKKLLDAYNANKNIKMDRITALLEKYKKANIPEDSFPSKELFKIHEEKGAGLR
jgi:hypothetical protein